MSSARAPRGRGARRVEVAARLASVLAIALAVGVGLAAGPTSSRRAPGVVRAPGGDVFADSTLADAVRALTHVGNGTVDHLGEVAGLLDEALAAKAAVAETREMLLDAVSRCRPSLPQAQRRRIADAIHAEATRHGYDPLFVLAMIEVESTCSPTANGKRGAVGLVQIKPSTARAVAKDLGVRWQGRSTLTQPLLNVRLGLSYLSQLEERFGDPYVAMAAYNMGPERVRRMPKARAKGARYVKKILARYEGLLVEHAA